MDPSATALREEDRPNDATATKSGHHQGVGWGLLALLGLGVAWRVTRYLLDFPFWGDESFLNINLLHRDYVGLARPLEYAQIAPLLFLWTQRTAFLFLGGGEYALRAVPALAGVAALLIYARLARRTLRPLGATLATGILAASYFLVRFTCESKPYATDLCVATVLLWLADRWRRNPTSVTQVLTLACVAGIALWLSYPAVFVAGGIALAMLWPLWQRRSWRAWGLWSAFVVITAMSFGAFYICFGSVQANRPADAWMQESWSESFPPLTGIADFLWWLLRIHTGEMFAYPLGGRHFGSSVTTVLCVVGVISLLVQRKRDLLLLLVAPALLGFVAALLHKYPYGGSARVSVYLAPSIGLLAGAGAAALIDRLRSPSWRRRAAGAVAIGLGAIMVLGIAKDIVQPAKVPLDLRIRSTTRELARQIQPGDGVAIVNPPYGTYGPPDGPIFHQTIRYYLELYTGIRPQWCSDGPVTRDVQWLLAYHGSECGPDRQRAEYWARHSGLEIVSAETHVFSAGSAYSLTVYRCIPRAIACVADRDSGTPAAQFLLGRRCQLPERLYDARRHDLTWV